MIAIVITLILCICVFEFINGFHDTANAVATVIYTKTLKPRVAVIYSWILNLLGVLVWGVWVAYSIVKLIPVLKISEYGPRVSLLVVVAILFTSILWNLYTRYKWLPCSSSHTLIWSIVGAVVGFCLLKMGNFDVVNWAKIKDIVLGLLISPVFGFAVTLVIVRLFRRYFNKQILFHRPAVEDGTPPIWIRTMLLTTCGLVSYFHGSNDGQKWIGLAMVTLVLLLPAVFMPDFTAKTAPTRLIWLISVSLWLGTMIGWKRIVVTIGEKIWRDHLSYIQWASAEFVGALTIGLSTYFHLPVSTTHTLSSWVAWSMVATGWIANIQGRTVRHIALAWIFTLPVCLVVSAAIVALWWAMFGL